MKRKFTFILIMAAFIVLPVMLNAQGGLNSQITSLLQSHQGIKQGRQLTNALNSTNTTTTTHLHGKSEAYFWDSASSSWSWYQEEITKYDSKGRVILDVQVSDTIAKDTSNETITTYDANGSIFDKSYSGSGTSLQLTAIDTTLNDNKGNEVRSVSYYNNGSSWSLSDGTIYKLTYDGNGNVVSEQELDYNNGKWVNTQENDYTVNADGSWTTWTEKRWNGAGWVNVDLFDSITWNSWKGWNFASNTNNTGFGGIAQIKYAVVQSWNGSKWQDTGRLSGTEGANGGSVSTIQFIVGGKYVNAEQISQSMDSLGNSTGFAIDTFNNGVWVLTGGEKMNYTYDANGNITQEIDQANEGHGYVNEEKFTYSGFSTVTGIKDANQQNLQLTLYPNPAIETLHLQEKTTTPGNMNISILNMQGRVIFNKQINGNELSSGINIPVNTFAKGMYILHAVSPGGDINEKFIKE